MMKFCLPHRYKRTHISYCEWVLSVQPTSNWSTTRCELHTKDAEPDDPVHRVCMTSADGHF